jgi:hypothetical protein
MAGISVAESSKPPKKGPKTLDHLELHAKMGGGHIVKHVYTGYQHDPMEVHFNEKGKAKGGEHITAHLAKHAGLPGYDNRDASETEKEIDA